MENKVKQLLANAYNYLYDVKLDIELFFRWRKDLHIQKRYGLPQILSVDDTLDRIISEKLSICRYGDGEFKIMDGDSIFFQSESGELAERLIEVIQSEYRQILVCIPSFIDRRHPTFEYALGLTREEHRRRRQAQKYMDNIIAERRLQWYGYFDMNRKYGDSLISRFYAGVFDDEKSKRWIEKWKRVWKERKLLIVEGEKTRLGVGNDLFKGATSIRRILAPAKGAFDVYDSILEKVIKLYKPGELVLIALGPTATVLAYDLAKDGIQALDIGHIDIEYEWFLRGDRTHKKIENKFVGEASGGAEVGEENDENYLSQIIAIVKEEKNAIRNNA